MDADGYTGNGKWDGVSLTITREDLESVRDALEDAEGYSFGNATMGEHQRRREALAKIDAILKEKE